MMMNNTSDWGPTRDPLPIVIPITIIYILIFLTGTMGNVCTCIVIVHNKSMHTTTNYYLISLAISDLLLLISGLPPEIYGIWSKYPYVFGEPFCVLRGLAAETSANATVLTITAFTIERYIAICHPFLSHTMSKLSRAIKWIALVWIFAICFAIPQAMALEVVYEVDEDHSACNIIQTVIPHAFEISTLFFFVVPLSLITVLYILIALQLRRSSIQSGLTRNGSARFKRNNSLVVIDGVNCARRVIANQSDDVVNLPQSSLEVEDEGQRNDDHYLQASKRVIKMLVAVVVAFFICWAPFHAQRLLAIYGKRDSTHVATTFSILTYISGILYYLSTTINPILYHIMSHRFRMAVKEILGDCMKSGRHWRARYFFTPALIIRTNVCNQRNSFGSFHVDLSFEAKGKCKQYNLIRHDRSMQKIRFEQNTEMETTAMGNAKSLTELNLKLELNQENCQLNQIWVFTKETWRLKRSISLDRL